MLTHLVTKHPLFYWTNEGPLSKQSTSKLNQPVFRTTPCLVMNADRETLVQKDNNRWQYILGHSVRLVNKSDLKWEIRFGSRMVEFQHLVQAFETTFLPAECAKTVSTLSKVPKFKSNQRNCLLSLGNPIHTISSNPRSYFTGSFL